MRVLLIAIALAAATFAGCGGDDDEGGGGSVGEAKQELVESCHRGNEDDPDDLKLCQCVGDRLENNEGFDTAEKFDAARTKVEDGDVPQEVQSAVNACQAQQQ